VFLLFIDSCQASAVIVKKIGAVKYILYLAAINKCLPVLYTFTGGFRYVVQFHTEHLLVIPSEIANFCEKGHIESEVS
jgi:hypothetical protein